MAYAFLPSFLHFTCNPYSSLPFSKTAIHLTWSSPRTSLSLISQLPSSMFSKYYLGNAERDQPPHLMKYSLALSSLPIHQLWRLLIRWLLIAFSSFSSTDVSNASSTWLPSQTLFSPPFHHKVHQPTPSPGSVIHLLCAYSHTLEHLWWKSHGQTSFHY